MASQLPAVSIIVPVFDDLEGLLVTLRSLDRLPSALSREVIVCSDGGPDVIKSTAISFGAKCVCLRGNQGSYRARNAGIAVARGEVIAFLDADQEVDSDWLAEGLSYFKNANCAYVGGRVEVKVPADADIWERYDGARAFSSGYFKSGFWPTANLFVRKELFLKVGRFRDDMRSAGDAEFGERVGNFGHGLAFAPRAVTFHPARKRGAIFAKSRRIAAGKAYLNVVVREQAWWLYIARRLIRVTLLPLRFVWRLSTNTTGWKTHGLGQHFAFCIFDELLIIHQSAFSAWYALAWRLNRFQPYQDPPISGRR